MSNNNMNAAAALVRAKARSYASDADVLRSMRETHPSATGDALLCTIVSGILQDLARELEAATA